MLNNLLKKMIIGLLIGLSTSFVIIACMTYFSDHITWTGKELLDEVFIAGGLGIVCGLSTSIFEINRLNFFAQLVLHYFAIMLSVFVAGLVGEWFSLADWRSVAKIFAIECIAYVIIWFMVRILVKKEVDEINDLIQHRKQG